MSDDVKGVSAWGCLPRGWGVCLGGRCMPMVVSAWGASAQGGICPRGVSAERGVCPGEVCQEGCLPRVYLPGGLPGGVCLGGCLPDIPPGKQ